MKRSFQSDRYLIWLETSGLAGNGRPWAFGRALFALAFGIGSGANHGRLAGSLLPDPGPSSRSLEAPLPSTLINKIGWGMATEKQSRRR